MTIIRALMLRTLCLAVLGLPSASSAGAAIPALDRTFSTSGHPKANRLAITLQLPASWVWKEASRPHVVQTFADSAANRNCNLLVRSLPNVVARKDVAAAIEEMGVGTALPAGLALVRKAATNLDGLPAVMAVSTGTFSSGGLEMTAMVSQFATIYRGDFIALTCTSRLSGANDGERMREDSTLYSLIANSLVITNQWTDKTW
jgi:hypothetical protein